MHENCMKKGDRVGNPIEAKRRKDRCQDLAVYKGRSRLKDETKIRRYYYFVNILIPNYEFYALILNGRCGVSTPIVRFSFMPVRQNAIPR